MSTLRARWTMLAGAAVALVLGGVLAWSLPAALDRDDRAAAAERLEHRLTAATAAASEDRAEAATVRSEIEAVEEAAGSLQTRLDRTERVSTRMRKDLRALRTRVSALGG